MRPQALAGPAHASTVEWPRAASRAARAAYESYDRLSADYPGFARTELALRLTSTATEEAAHVYLPPGEGGAVVIHSSPLS